MRLHTVRLATVSENDRVLVDGEGLVPGARASAWLHGQLYKAGEAPQAVHAHTMAVITSPERVELIAPALFFEGGHSTFRGDILLTVEPHGDGDAVEANSDSVVFDAVASHDDSEVQGRRGEAARAFLAGWGMSLVRESGQGLRVVHVDARSRAEQAGLEVGDQILAANGLRVLRIEDMAPSPEGSWSAEVRRGNGTLVLHGPAAVPSVFRIIALCMRYACFYLGLLFLGVGLAWRGGLRGWSRARARLIPVLALASVLGIAAPWLDARITLALLLVSWGAWSVGVLRATSVTPSSVGVLRAIPRGPSRVLRPLVAYAALVVVFYGQGGISLAELSRGGSGAPSLLMFFASAFGLMATAFAGRARPHADLASAWLLAALAAPFGFWALLSLVILTASLALSSLIRAKVRVRWLRASRSSVSAAS